MLVIALDVSCGPRVPEATRCARYALSAKARRGGMGVEQVRGACQVPVERWRSRMTMSVVAWVAVIVTTMCRPRWRAEDLLHFAQRRTTPTILVGGEELCSGLDALRNVSLARRSTGHRLLSVGVGGSTAS